MGDLTWEEEERRIAAELAKRPPKPIPLDQRRRVYRNNSYYTCVQIFEANDRDVLGPASRLEYDEMVGRVMLNRKPLEDVDELRIRGDIERLFVGGIDQGGNQKGMKQSLA